MFFVCVCVFLGGVLVLLSYHIMWFKFKVVFSVFWV